MTACTSLGGAQRAQGHHQETAGQGKGEPGQARASQDELGSCSSLPLGFRTVVLCASSPHWHRSQCCPLGMEKGSGLGGRRSFRTAIRARPAADQGGEARRHNSETAAMPCPSNTSHSSTGNVLCPRNDSNGSFVLQGECGWHLHPWRAASEVLARVPTPVTVEGLLTGLCFYRDHL